MMKKLAFLCCVFLACMQVLQAQYVAIPDSNFRKYLYTQIPGCFNSEGRMDTTCSGVLDMKLISCNNEWIRDLEGVQYFKNLTTLLCYSNQLTSLPSLPNALKQLWCHNNQLVSLPALPKALMDLNCSDNQLASLPTLPNTLTYLWCGENQLTSLPSLPDTLQRLYCASNNLVSLPSLPNTLTTLRCYNNGLISLPTLPDSLTELDCHAIQMASLPALPNTLTKLDCSYNQLTSLPTLPNTLTNLYCYNNQLTSLPSLPNALYSLDCSNNQLISLPSLPNTLSTLWCNNNQLTSLPMLPKLFDLYCHANQLRSLPALPNALMYLYCSSNQLVSLPALPKALMDLNCSDNQLASLPTLPNTLLYLVCKSNLLATLPTLPNKFQILDCSSNQLIAMPYLASLANLRIINCSNNTNLTCLPKLPEWLDSLNISNTGIKCVPNKPAAAKFNGLLICNPTNNANDCVAFPTVIGRVFGDNNRNGIKDANEQYLPNIPVVLKGGDIAYTNALGKYALTTSDTGSFSVSVAYSKHYTSTPSQYEFSCTTNNVVLTLPDFALQPNEQENALGIDINNWQAAIPGRLLAYSVSCYNKDALDKAVTVSFTYDTLLLHFDSASIANITVAGGVISWKDTLEPNYFNSIAGWNTFQYPTFYFTVATTARMGNLVHCSAAVTDGNKSAKASKILDVRTSYDPNSKEATELLTTAQVVDGETIDYRIHFQNLGNASAKDIVIADTLSPLLTSGIIEMQGRSHDCKIMLHNNILYFQFKNIYLIDSATNEMESKGFVHFRVKPTAAVTDGMAIDNKASIYFDYNDPIVTNTATTLIKNVVLPVSLRSYELTTNPNRMVNNHWATVTETNTAYFNVQRSIGGGRFVTIGRVAAKGNSAYYSFTDAGVPTLVPNAATVYYRLEIVDKNGQISYSETKSIYISHSNVSLRLYPNPAKDYLMVQGAGISGVSIVDGFGRVVWANNAMDIADVHKKIHFKLDAGMYMVRLQLEGGTVVNQKLVVDKAGK